jgi:hypothetical protein
MLFPDPKDAVIDLAKLRDYCLSPDHPRGKHKARVFHTALGLGSEDATRLRDLIMKAIPGAECMAGVIDSYGNRFSTDLPISFQGRSVVLRTAWMIPSGEKFPKLTTCYIK